MGFLSNIFSSQPNYQIIDFPENLLTQNWEKISELVTDKIVDNNWYRDKNNTKYTPLGTTNAILNGLEGQGAYKERVSKNIKSEWRDPQYRYDRQRNDYNIGRQKFSFVETKKYFCVWPKMISEKTIQVKVDLKSWKNYLQAAEYFRTKIKDPKVLSNITPLNLYLANFVLYSQITNQYHNKTVFDLYMYDEKLQRVVEIQTRGSYPNTALGVYINTRTETVEEFSLKENLVRIIPLKHSSARPQQADDLILYREPDNKWDPNAVLVVLKSNRLKLGYLPQKVARVIAPELDRGMGFYANIIEMKNNELYIRISPYQGNQKPKISTNSSRISEIDYSDYKSVDCLKHIDY